jgi:hypothetical protein
VVRDDGAETELDPLLPDELELELEPESPDDPRETAPPESPPLDPLETALPLVSPPPADRCARAGATVIANEAATAPTRIFPRAIDTLLKEGKSNQPASSVTADSRHFSYSNALWPSRHVPSGAHGCPIPLAGLALHFDTIEV